MGEEEKEGGEREGRPRKGWVCGKRKAQGARYVVRGLDRRPHFEELRNSVGVAVVCRPVEGSLARLHRKGTAGE
eukprot:scaffold238949_cov27-Tisochrysis_lutea.AAC.1